MTITQLELFIEASRTLNFTRTGEHFFISQSAVTQQIKNLEDELQVTLFKRNKKKLKLTEAGQLFVLEAQSLIDHTHEAISRVRSVQVGDIGHLNIGYLSTMDTAELSTTIYNYHTRFPGVHLNLTHDHAVELYRDFQVGKYDVIFNISDDQFDYTDAVSIPVRTFGLVVCMPPNHRLANNKLIRQQDLLNEQLIILTPNIDSSSSHLFMPKLKLPDLLNNIVALENDAAAATFMVAAGLGIAVIPAIGTDSIKQHLVCVPLDTGDFRLSIMMHYRKDNPNPAIEHFVAACQPL